MGSNKKNGPRGRSRREFIRQAGAGAFTALAGGNLLAQLSCAANGQRRAGDSAAAAVSSAETSAATSAAAATGGAQPSRLPLDVVLDYSYDAVHLSNGAGSPLYAAEEKYRRFSERLRQYPPDVLIVGKEAPFTHSLGPILSFGGENRTFPQVRSRPNEDPQRRLTPAELRLRIQAIKRFTDESHAAGVRQVLPYISPMTMFGNPERRLGFFDFYDHWDEYAAAFQLGRRPAGDPVEWTQEDPEGDIASTFGQSKRYGAFTRYSMCVNKPGWRQWQTTLARAAAQAGYDGLWMDNVLVHRCYCEHCQRIARELGLNLKGERQEVWAQSYLRYFDDLRRESGRPNFFLAGNHGDLHHQRTVTDKLDLSMVESVWLGTARLLWPGGVWTGYYPDASGLKVLNNRTRRAEGAQTLNNIWVSQLAYAMRGARGVHFLYGSPAAGKRADEFAHNEDSALLALAEGAAFGGGVAVTVASGSPFVDEDYVPAHRARKTFHAFARQRRQLYENLWPAGDVAILVFPDQEISALLEAQQVHDSLLWRGVLADVINGDTASESSLRQRRLVVVPGQPQLPAWARSLNALRGTDPITEQDVREVRKSYQRDRTFPQLCRTRLSDAVAGRAGETARALTLPADAQVQACAWADERRMVLHVLNYKVPIGLANGGAVKPVGDITVRLNAPAGRRARRVEVHTPDVAAASTVQFRQEGGAVVFRPPALRVYAVYEVSF